MGRPTKHFGRSKLGLGEQRAHLRLAWPQFATTVNGNHLVTRGVLRPSAAHREYTVRVEYSVGSLPKAYVDNPALVPREPDGKIPHTYPGPRPCLYHAPSGEWRPFMRLSETVVPWLMLWLFYYEIWLTTATWHGGGIEHGPNGK